MSRISSCIVVCSFQQKGWRLSSRWPEIVSHRRASTAARVVTKVGDDPIANLLHKHSATNVQKEPQPKQVEISWLTVVTTAKLLASKTVSLISHSMPYPQISTGLSPPPSNCACTCAPLAHYFGNDREMSPKWISVWLDGWKPTLLMFLGWAGRCLHFTCISIVLVLERKWWRFKLQTGMYQGLGTREPTLGFSQKSPCRNVARNQNIFGKDLSFKPNVTHLLHTLGRLDSVKNIRCRCLWPEMYTSVITTIISMHLHVQTIWATEVTWG